MFGSDFVQYFSVPECPHQLRREKFMSYGTCGTVNIEIDEIPESDENSCVAKNASDVLYEAAKRVKFICQTIRDRSDGRYELMAKTPCIPLMSPRRYYHLFFNDALDLLVHKFVSSKLSRSERSGCTPMKLLLCITVERILDQYCDFDFYNLSRRIINHDYQNEPCISAIKQDLQKLKNTIIHLKRACSRMRLKSNQKLAQDLLSKLESLDASEGARIFSDELSTTGGVDDSTIEQLFSGGFTRQVGILATRSKDIIGKKLYKCAVNTEYAGGSLRYDQRCRPMGDCLGGVLLLPSGPRLDHLNIRHLSVSKDGFQVAPVDCELKMDGRIMEISTATVYNQSLAACRHGGSCSMIRLQHADSSSNVEVINSQTFIVPEKPAAVCMSPHIPGECFIATNIGSVYLWSVNDSFRTRQICTENGNHSDMLMNTWRGCHFGGHPRLAVLSDRASVTLLDLRGSGNAFLDLCKLPQSFLEKNEYISASCQLVHSPFYHMIATDLSIMLMDERYPNYPVLLWNHSLVSPPLYMDVVCHAVPACNDDVLLVASQDPPETHCFQFRLNSSMNRPPQAYGPPWRVSMPEDCVLLAALEGNSKGYSALLPRLKAPLAGMCVVPHAENNGFSVVQMTSFGDVFSQPYIAMKVDQPTLPDKTCSAGLGCESVKILPEYVAKTQCWLEAAEHQMLPVTSDVAYDAQPLMKRLCRPSDCSTECPLCQPTDANIEQTCSSLVALEDDGSCCVSCGNSIAAGRLIQRRNRRELYPDSVANVVVTLPNNADMFVDLDKHLKDANPDEFFDAESRLLVKLWNDNDDIEEELKERSVQDRLIMKQCGMVADIEMPTSDIEDDSSSEDYPVARGDSARNDTCSEDPAELSPSKVFSIVSSFNLISSNAVDGDTNSRRRSASQSPSSSDDELVDRVHESVKQTITRDDDNNDYYAYLSLIQSLKPDKFGF